MVSEICTKPRLYVPRAAKPSPVPTRSVPAERPCVGDICYLLVVGLVAAGIIGIVFGSAFSLLIPPRDKTVVGAGAVSSRFGANCEHRNWHGNTWRSTGCNRCFCKHRRRAGGDVGCTASCAAPGPELDFSCREIHRLR
jgi:hypothetical protein